MNGKNFLHYLVKEGNLSEHQAEECLMFSTTQNQIEETLLQKGYFSPKFLQQCLAEFRKNSTSFSLPSLKHSQEETILKQLDFLSQTEEKKVFATFTEEKTLIASVSPKETQFPTLMQTPLNTNPEVRYQILKLLGEGGMGVVQLVKDQILGREVALKQIKLPHYAVKKLSNNQKMMLWRLNKEASITAILEHPNIVPLYEIQQREEGELCFTMRKVEGSTLRDILKAKQEGDKTYDENKLLGIFLKICDAVSYAHSKGVIHRDLKPDNIMVGQFGEVYVMDWGIAKRLNESETLNVENATVFEKNEPTEVIGTIGGIGTEGYMPPEQAHDASLATSQSDIYALGKILRECFTLLSPKEEFNQQVERDKRQRKLAINRKVPKKNTSENSSEKIIPEEILAIIEKATKKEKNERYVSIKEMSKDIESYQKNLQISVKKYSSLESFIKWAKRHQSQIRIIATVSSILFISFFLYIHWVEIQEVQSNLAIAKIRMKEGEDITSPSKFAQSQKIEKMLYALHALNAALLIKPKATDTEKIKWDLGKKLIDLCCATEDYNLATFVANDMKNLSSYKEEKKTALLIEVESKQNEMSHRHWKRFKELKEKFWNKTFEYGTGEREDRWCQLKQSLPKSSAF